jgi:hypothetical protein
LLERHLVATVVDELDDREPKSQLAVPIAVAEAVRPPGRLLVAEIVGRISPISGEYVTDGKVRSSTGTSTDGMSGVK